VIEVGEAIPVNSHRERAAGGDPIMENVKRHLQTMLGNLAAERAESLGLQLAARPTVPPAVATAS
jgi:hypothetical protein